MTRRIISRLVLLFAFLFFVSGAAFCEEITDNDFGYSLDIPEGFKVSEYTPDGMTYRFTHDRFPVSLILKLYADGRYSSSTAALKGTLDKLGAEYDIDSFEWRNTECSVSNFKMQLSGFKPCSGWAEGVVLPETGAQLILVCYADDDKFQGLSQFIISTLNSLSIDRSSNYEPGIFTTYAYPETGSKSITLNIAGQKINTSMDAVSEEANQFIIDCEWSVLSLYAGNDKWKEAWIRYYRAIFRDSYSRLKKVSFDIASALEPIAKKKNSANPEEAINEILLNWVQNFEYKRAAEKAIQSDFTSLPAVLTGTGNDCDSRSMLMCVLLKNMGYDTCLFVSREYSHAVYGVDLPVQGAKIEAEGVEYLLGETTAKNIKPGLIDSQMRDTFKWIPVTLNWSGK